MSSVRLFPRETGAPALVVTDAECMNHARVDLESELPQLQLYARAAQAHIETWCDLPLTRRSFIATASDWPSAGPLGGWEVWLQQIESIDEIEYLDGDGNPAILPAGDYALRNRLRAGLIHFPAGFGFPGILPGSDISISLTAGYAANACDDLLKALVLMGMSDMYDNRSAALSPSVQAAMAGMLVRYRLLGIG